MDVDLSTDLDVLAPLLERLLQGRADVAIGSRLAPGAEVVRGLKPEIISRGYTCYCNALLGTGVSDAQCGFKAARREVPVHWVDDPTRAWISPQPLSRTCAASCACVDAQHERRAQVPRKLIGGQRP
jgi:hypothetical protein